jgi:hypothetical protein
MIEKRKKGKSTSDCYSHNYKYMSENTIPYKARQHVCSEQIRTSLARCCAAAACLLCVWSLSEHEASHVCAMSTHTQRQRATERVQQHTKNLATIAACNVPAMYYRPNLPEIVCEKN